jgi:hypothetical protein
MTSGKVSLMKYDDFEGKPIPEMIQRVKINLREQEIDVFDYTAPYTPYPLYFKCRLIPQGFPNYEKQTAFDKKLASLDCLNLAGFGPSRDELYSTLSDLGLAIRDFDFRSTR